MFTSMAALKLRDAGKVKLDDPISVHLAGCPEAWKSVTVRQLMRHTSGIPDYEEPLELGSERYLAVMTQEGTSGRLVEDAKKKQLDFPPGTKFRYSNTGYLVLARLVEVAAGRPFNDFLTERLLKPAGMTRAGMFDGKSVPDGSGRVNTSRALLGEAPGRDASDGRSLVRARDCRSRRRPATPGSTARWTTFSRGAAPWTGARSFRRRKRTKFSHPDSRAMATAGSPARVPTAAFPAQRRAPRLHVRLREVPRRRNHDRRLLQPRPARLSATVHDVRRLSSESPGTCRSMARSPRFHPRITRVSRAFTRCPTGGP